MTTNYVEGEAEQSKGFDFGNYHIDTTPKSQEIHIPDTGDSFTIQVKDLSWARRNQILSQSIKIDAEGSTTFNGDVYVRACLKEMIVEAPWGRTTEQFLLSIDARLGGVLEDLVPKAFDQTGTVAADAVKKE